jgi:hypothetical protein
MAGDIIGKKSLALNGANSVAWRLVGTSTIWCFFESGASLGRTWDRKETALQQQASGSQFRRSRLRADSEPANAIAISAVLPYRYSTQPT